MDTKTRRFNIAIRNHVQLIGFRGFIESIARDFGLKGYVYNDKDGSVKIVCEGIETAVGNFLDDLKKFSADIKVEKEEITDIAFLPDDFGRVVAADEYGIRLDRGLKILEAINKDTRRLEPIQNTLGGIQNSLSGVQDTQSSMDDKLTGIQDTLKGMDGKLGDMTDILRRIAEK
jgi:acylphosphatase